MIKALVLELISPLKLSFFLIVLALIARYFFKRVKLSNYLALVSISWLLIWSQPYSADLLLYPLERSEKATNQLYKANSQPDYILVLACYYNTQGDVPEVSRWSHCSLQRLVQAAILHAQTKSKIVLTGGYFLENENINYSQKAEAFLISLGVPSQDIIKTNEGTNTQEEISSANNVINQKEILVVTTATHVLRVTKELEGASKTVSFFPVDYHSGGDLTPYLTLPSLAALEGSRLAFYEYLALIKQQFN